MRCGVIAKKIGMTRSFSKEGTDTPVTVLKLENVQVTAIMNSDRDGFIALQVGAGTAKTKNLTKPMRGHFAKAKVEPKKILREFIVSEDMKLNIGDTFSTNHYVIGQKIDVSGTSIGKGFSGAMKRHNFSGLRASHGVSISHRSHGSTGNSQDPGKVWKGKKMAGQYGNVKKTIQSLTVVDINEEEDLIFVKGSVPGAKNSFVFLKDALKSELPDAVLKPAGLKNNTDNLKIKNDENSEKSNKNDVQPEENSSDESPELKNNNDNLQDEKDVKDNSNNLQPKEETSDLTGIKENEKSENINLSNKDVSENITENSSKKE